jgi:hypothetical protein
VTALLTTVVSIDGSLFAVLLLASVHPTARPETPSRPTAPVP